MIFGAKSRSPAVAITDKANPASRLCHGSAITTAPIAKPSAGNESRARPLPCASSNTAAIAAARKTDGDGRTSAINAINVSAVAPSLHLSLRTKNCISQSTNPETIAKFAPLTATKWVSPDLFIDSLNCALCFEVSPRTIPGINAPESPSPLISRRPVLMLPSVRARRDAGVRTVISPSRSASTATRASSLRITRARPLKLWPGNNEYECES